MTKKITIYILAFIVFLIATFPFIWMVSTSFKTTDDIYKEIPTIIPRSFTLEHYSRVLFESNFTRAFLNSVIVTVITIFIGISISIFAAYALSRFTFLGSNLSLMTILSVQMFPRVVLVIPLFIIMSSLNLLNSYIGLIITYTTFVLPYSVWMLKGFFDSIPFALEEAAQIDGCTQVEAFIRIILPIAGPGVAATSIYSFILGWNELMFALTFINDEKMKTLPLALTSFIGRNAVRWGDVMAAATIFTIPTVIFFIYVRRKLTTALSQGAVKG